MYLLDYPIPQIHMKVELSQNKDDILVKTNITRKGLNCDFKKKLNIF